MRIINADNVEISLSEVDFSVGHLVPGKIIVKEHEPVEAVEEVGHYEVTKEYPNGGRDVAWVVDVPGIEGKDGWTEYEDVLIFTLYKDGETQEVFRDDTVDRLQRRISSLESTIINL